MPPSEPEPSVDEKFRRVVRHLRPVYSDVRRSGDAAVVIFRVPNESRPFGLRIDLVDTSREFFYSDPVGSFAEWLEYLDVYVMVSLETGVANRSPRVDRGDYLEVVEDPCR